MSRDAKRRVLLWLHRWLVRLGLLKSAGRVNNTGKRFQVSQTITIDDPDVITVTGATAATVFDPREVTVTAVNQASIPKPVELILTGIIELTIQEPGEVVIEDSNLVMIKESVEEAGMNESITFPYPETVIIQDARTLTLTVHGNGDSYSVSGTI